MPSPLRSQSRCRSATSCLALVLAAAAAAALAGCSDDDSCGPGDEEAAGVTALGITFAEMTASANNDCPPTVGEHPTAITIQGSQIDPAADGQYLVFCLPRPELIDDQPVPITDSDRIELVDFFGKDSNGCDIRFDRTADPGNGAVTFSGFCDNGTASAGFALSLSGVLPFTRTCDGDPADPVTAELGGRAAVAAAGS